MIPSDLLQGAPRIRHTEAPPQRRGLFIEGAEEDSWRRLGRGLPAEELERVLLRYPGDVA
jgi:hypothetical protein